MTKPDQWELYYIVDDPYQKQDISNKNSEIVQRMAKHYEVWVDIDDLNEGVNKKGKLVANDLYYSVEGDKTLGKRFTEKAIELVKK